MTCWKTENLKNLGKKSIWKICNGSLRETLSPSESRIDNMSVLLLGNQPSKTMLALFRQTWHWELLFTWPSASTQNKALHSIHEPAPPVLFILGGVILPTSVRNGYFQADGRRFGKMWSRLMCRSHRDKASHHLWELWWPCLQSDARRQQCTLFEDHEASPNSYWSQKEFMHWFSSFWMRFCVNAALTCMLILVLPDD